MKINFGSSRVPWVDNAKALGIILVFYLHFIQNCIYEISNESFFTEQHRFACSFVMNLFFLLAGYIAANKPATFKLFLFPRLGLRIAQIVVLNLIIVPFYYFFYDCSFFDILKEFSKRFFLGIPNINYPTWFLVCLLTVEIYYFFCNKLHLVDTQKLPALIFLSGLMGFMLVYINPYLNYSNVSLQFWYLNEGFIVLSFYLLGVSLRSLKIIEVAHKKIPLLAFATLCTAILLNTYNLNITGQSWNSVSISEALNGSPVFFYFNALTGSLIVILLAKVIRPFSFLTYIGKNSLAFYGINGLFLHFLNNEIIKHIIISQQRFYLFIACIFGSLLSLLICFPMVYVLNKIFSLITSSFTERLHRSS